MNENTKVVNDMLDRMSKKVSPQLVVNVQTLLHGLKNMTSIQHRPDGQTYRYVTVEDLSGALESVITQAQKACNSIHIQGTEDWETVIQTHFQGIAEAKRVLRKSHGCSTIQYLNVSISSDDLAGCIALYDNLGGVG